MECAERKEIPDISMPTEGDLERPKPELTKVRIYYIGLFANPRPAEVEQMS